VHGDLLAGRDGAARAEALDRAEPGVVVELVLGVVVERVIRL